MKKISLILVLALFVTLLAGCYQGVVTSEMTINSLTGEGTKTIRCDIYKDTAPKPDGSGMVADNFAGDNPYFLKPIDDVVALLNSKAPAGVTVTKEEKDDKYVLVFTYSFTDLADYNAKTKAMIGDKLWTDSDMSDATLTAVDSDNGKAVTFTEDIEVLKNSVRWAAEALINDTTGVYNSARAKGEGLTADGSTTSIFLVESIAITVGDKTEVFKSDATAITVTGNMPNPPAVEEEPAQEETTEATEEPVQNEENPKTGDNLTVYIALAVAALAVITIALSVKSKKASNKA